jgi:hypothetical protein
MPVVNTLEKSGFVDDGTTSGCRMRSKKVTRERKLAAETKACKRPNLVPKT